MRIRRGTALLLTVLMLAQLLMTTAWAMPGENESGFGSAANMTTDAGTKTFYDYTPRYLQSSETLRMGVDVSYYQGHPDWDAVYASGVDFAFIRVGYRTYGTNRLYEDQYYAQNIEEALAAGLRVGVYIYSQAATPQEAVEEAQFLLDRVAGYDISLPLVMDFEYACNINGNLTGHLYEANLSTQEATDVIQAFFTTVWDAGYTPCLYASKNVLENDVYADQFDSVWVAHFTSETDYSGDYDFWQCSESGIVDGIKNSVDLDFWYDDGCYNSPSYVTPFPFRDVTPADWSYSSVKYCFENGIISGRTATSFDPSCYTTRGEVVTMLYRAAGRPEVEGYCSFTDLTMDYYRTPILWAQQTGITAGRTETTFDPDSWITREEFVTLLYRFAGKPEVSGSFSGYTDAGDISAYAQNAMLWAYQNGIMMGTSDTTLSPQNYATREQIAAFIARFMKLS